MPIYSYICPLCKNKDERFLPLSRYTENQFCYDCGREEPMKRLISNPRVIGDYSGYICPVTGNWIEGRKAHKENLKRTGCRVLEPGEKEEATKHREANNKRLESEIEHEVGRQIEQLDTTSREKLAAEMDSNLSIDIERR